MIEQLIIILVILNISLMLIILKPFNLGLLSFKSLFFIFFVLSIVKDLKGYYEYKHVQDYDLILISFYTGTIIGLIYLYLIVSITKINTQNRFKIILEKSENMVHRYSAVKLWVLYILAVMVSSIPGYFIIITSADVLGYRKLVQLGGLGLPYIYLFISTIVKLLFILLILKHLRNGKMLMGSIILIIALIYSIPYGSNSFTVSFILIFIILYTEVIRKGNVSFRFYSFIAILSMLIIFLISIQYLLRWGLPYSVSEINIVLIINIFLNRFFENYFGLFLERFDYEFLYGLSFLNLFLQPIPRFIFPEKPYLTDDYITYKYFFEQDALLQFGTIAEGYINFGILGAFLWGVMASFAITGFVILRYVNVFFYIFTTISITQGILGFDFGVNRYFMTSLIYNLIFILFAIILVRRLCGIKQRKSF